MSVAVETRPIAAPSQPAVSLAAALRLARIARRPARLLRLHRLHRARRDGDRGRRLGGGQPRRGLAREGRTLLGGDVAFVAVPARGERRPRSRSCARAARSRPSRRCAAMARAAPTGGSRWSRSRRSIGAYPMLGTLTLEPPTADRAICSPSRTARSARPPIRPCWRGSISRPAIASRSATRRFQLRSEVEAEPDKLGAGVGFGPRFLVSEDGLRATGLVQPGSLVRWSYRVQASRQCGRATAPPPR